MDHCKKLIKTMAKMSNSITSNQLYLKTVDKDEKLVDWIVLQLNQPNLILWLTIFEILIEKNYFNQNLIKNKLICKKAGAG